MNPAVLESIKATHRFDTGEDALDRAEQISNLVERYGENKKSFLKDMCMQENARLPLRLRLRILKSKNKVYYWNKLIEVKRILLLHEYETGELRQWRIDNGHTQQDTHVNADDRIRQSLNSSN